MKYVMGILITVIIAAVNGGYVDGMTYQDALTGNIIMFAYFGWMLKDI